MDLVIADFDIADTQMIFSLVSSGKRTRSVFANVRTFLAETLALTVSEEKSDIHKASDGAAFLGYEPHIHDTPAGGSES